MTGNLDWGLISDMIALGGYSGSAALSNNAALLALIALSDLQNEKDWTNYSDFDEISEAIDSAIAEIMSPTPGGGDMIKIAEAVATSDVASLTINNFTAGTFRTHKLVVQGLKSNYATTWVDGLLIRVNGRAFAGDYNDMCFYENLTAQYRYENLGVKTGLYIKYCMPTIYATNYDSSHFEATMFYPQLADLKTIILQGLMTSSITTRYACFRLVGNTNSNVATTSITILPELGTAFKIDPAQAIYPDELRMTLYGLQ